MGHPALQARELQSMAKKEQPESKRAHDIAAAIDALWPYQMEGLLFYAHFRLLRAGGNVRDSDARDLLHEAMLRTLDGRRVWNPQIPFKHHLMGCMSSIAHEFSKKANKLTELSDTHGSKNDVEAAVDAKINTDRLRIHLKGDVVALNVLDTLLDGVSPKEALEALHINTHVYLAARKRISRLCARLFSPARE